MHQTQSKHVEVTWQAPSEKLNATQLSLDISNLDVTLFSAVKLLRESSVEIWTVMQILGIYGMYTELSLSSKWL